MSYKFNRNCWVESLEERLFCANLPQDESGGDETGGKDFSPAEIAAENTRQFRSAEPVAIEVMIEGAESIFARWGEELKKEDRIGRLIQRLETNLENSRQGMHDLGIFRACARCDVIAPEGSCCSLGLERKYGPILLVMNLMLGVSLPQRRLRADSCYFLGREGCRLKVRHMLCIDYLCPELEETLGLKALIKIQTLSGQEIESAFLLREAIKEKIRTLRE
jgi:hypothetical protein